MRIFFSVDKVFAIVAGPSPLAKPSLIFFNSASVKSDLSMRGLTLLFHRAANVDAAVFLGKPAKVSLLAMAAKSGDPSFFWYFFSSDIFSKASSCFCVK